MQTEKRLIDLDEAIDALGVEDRDIYCKHFLEERPTVDAVEVAVLKTWLYEIAMNNSDNYLGDACEVLIGRLDGLREFARERREGE